MSRLEKDLENMWPEEQVGKTGYFEPDEKI